MARRRNRARRPERVISELGLSETVFGLFVVGEGALLAVAHAGYAAGALAL